MNRKLVQTYNGAEIWSEDRITNNVGFPFTEQVYFWNYAPYGELEKRGYEFGPFGSIEEAIESFNKRNNQ